MHNIILHQEDVERVIEERILDLNPRGEIGSIEVVSNFSTASNLAVPIPGSTIPVEVNKRPLKVSVSATVLASVADTLGAIVIYEDGDIVKYMYYKSPSAGSYQSISAAMRRNPSPGLHAYQAYIANFTASGTFGLFTLDPQTIGLEIIVEEV